MKYVYNSDDFRNKSAVDGLSGATITCNGVTDAYRKVLSEYQPYLIRVNNGDV